jgi:hypothetical protein
MLAAEHSVNLLPFLLAHQCRVRQCQVDEPPQILSVIFGKAWPWPQALALDPKRLLSLKYGAQSGADGSAPGLATAKWMSCLIALVSPRFRS